MTRHTRSRALAAAALLVAPLPVVALATPTASAANGPLASSIALAWQRTAVLAMNQDTSPALPPPVGMTYHAFMSLAVHEAAQEGQRHGTRAAAAAVATAAHDVLWHYVTTPAARQRIGAQLVQSLDRIPDGRQEDRGIEIGAQAAARMISSRVDDGRFDTTVVYSKAPGPGVWQPAPGGGMALAWLAFLAPVVDVPTVQVDGPDPLGSPAYATDYAEVMRVGSETAPLDARSADQTVTARFLNAGGNPIPMYRHALLDRLESEPLGLIPTTRLFARIDAATTEAFIQTWRLKYDVGFWRPFQAIAGAATDGNDATEPAAGWRPLIPNPAYSDYTSGHAAATAPFAEIVRHTLGEDTALELRLAGFDDRAYASLSALEHDAFMARIWGGLHFRDAMEDGYLLGHTVADAVIREIR